MMITDPDEAKEQLLKWSSDFANVQITEAALSLDGVSIDATTRLGNGYSVASVFLQVRDPEIALVKYRSQCKEFKVADAIKASDKAQIVAEFTVIAPTAAIEFQTKTQTQQQQPPSAAASATKSAAPQPPPDSSKEDRQHRSSTKSSSSSSGHKRPPPPPPPVGGSSNSRHHKKSDKATHHHQVRKKPELVTTEQLFANLNGVVDKRSVGLSKIEAAITNALSTVGFEVNETTVIDEAARKRTAAIMAKEIPVGNSASILRSNDPRKDLKRALELYNEAVMINPKVKDNGKSSSALTSANNNSSAGIAASPSKRNMRSHLIGKKPVIVVPKGMTAPITLLNAHAFFHAATFVPREQVKNRTNFPTKFTRNVMGNILLEFDITDNPVRYFEGGTKDWDRIVAVIVLGQDWQFKDWIPGFNAPATLFERVFGYYIGHQPPAQWAVKSGMLHKDKRALDSIAYNSFWTQLEEWMRVHKPELILKTNTAAD